MIPSVPSRRIAALKLFDTSDLYKPQATVLVATNDSEIRDNIAGLLQLFPLKTVWAKGMEEVKSVLARESVTACLCGFWLVDGTYRDVVRHLKLQRTEVQMCIRDSVRKGLESSSAKQEQLPEQFRQLAPRMATNLPFEF